MNLLNGHAAENGFEEAQAAGRKPFSCVGVRVLAVDDEEMNLVVAKGVLGSYGIQVDTCLSGKEAIEKCSAISYDIIFLDHMMPGFDGVETLKRIREINNGIYRDLPVIALTANTISGAREMFRHEGFTEFIPKPIERAVLERVLRRVLPKHCIRYGTTPNDSEPSSEETVTANETVVTSEAVMASEAAADETATAGETATEDEAAMIQEPAASSPFDPLTRVGINIQLGLEYCVGEADFYTEMLQLFCSQGPEKRDEIASLYQAANWKDYAIKVHALKSTSLTIGAEALSEQAKQLELAGKAEDVEYIRQNHAALLSKYDEVCQSIAAL